jgi:hypothetical protein
MWFREIPRSGGKSTKKGALRPITFNANLPSALPATCPAVRDPVRIACCVLRHAEVFFVIYDQNFKNRDCNPL